MQICYTKPAVFCPATCNVIGLDCDLAIQHLIAFVNLVKFNP